MRSGIGFTSVVGLVLKWRRLKLEIKLWMNTNFIDSYDPPISSADACNYQWNRLNYDTVLDRQAQFELLNDIGIETVDWGLLSSDSVVSAFDGKILVAYYYPSEHQGLGKGMLRAEELKKVAKKIRSGTKLLYSVFIETSEDPLRSSISYRYVKVGKRLHWWIRYENDGDWRAHSTNHRQAVVLPPDEVEEIFGDLSSKIESVEVFNRFPLLAVDFVATREGQFKAIEIDLSPVLGRETPQLAKGFLFDQISAHCAECIDSMFDFSVKAIKLGSPLASKKAVLTDKSQLVHLPYETRLRCLESGKTWTHRFNPTSPRDSFLRDGSTEFTAADVFFQSNYGVIQDHEL
jgi:hypothetical protein